MFRSSAALSCPPAFFLFLLVVSRIYEPMNFALQNLAAMNSMQVDIDRMNEINDCQEHSGGTSLAPKGYDIAFENVGFACNSGETVLIIAHRMRTEENANKIVMLSGGAAAGTGTLAELMKQGGGFVRLVPKLQ